MSRTGSEKVTTECTNLHDGSDSDSEFVGEAGEPPNSRHAVSIGTSRSSLAASPRFALPPSSTDVPVLERLEDDLT